MQNENDMNERPPRRRRSEEDCAPSPLRASGASDRRAFTGRSFLFGVLGLFIVAVGAGYHHTVLGKSGVWMISHHMPPIVFAYMMALGLGWNGVMGRWRPRWMLSPQELVVVMIMTMVACFPASAGLMRYALRNLMLPWYYLPGQPEWRAHGLLEDLLASKLFPSPAPYRSATGVLWVDEHVYRGFFGGLSNTGKWTGLSAIPWSSWLPAMAYWGPLVATMSLTIIAMTFLVHRQWSEHEQLSYPVAQVASSFWSRADGTSGVPDVFRNRLFWAGFVPLFLLLLLDYASGWHPESLPRIEHMLPNLKQWAAPVLEKMPTLRKAPGAGYLSSQRISFAIVGLAYFVSSEISLTMGLSQFFLSVAGLFFYWSVGTPVTAGEMDVNRAGAYLGYTLILLYTGRTYFGAVFRKAFLLRGEEPGGSAAVLAARVMVLAFAGFVGVLTLMGCDWLMALLYGLTLMMLFLVFTRVICETGIPFLQANWTADGVLVALLGPAALGPKALTLLTWTNTIIAQDPRECLMPYVATSVRMASDAKLRMRRVFAWIVAAVALALVVAFVSHLWVLYNFGPLHDGWSGTQVPKQPFNAAARWIGVLKTTGDYGVSEAARGFGRLRLVQADPSALRFFLAGGALVVLFSTIRFRFSRFPIHPVLFLAWGSWPAGISWAAYLIGWFIKTLVVRLGGGRAYQRLKPVFIGIIAAELIAVASVVLVDFLYYWVTGHPTGVSTTIQSN